MILHPRLDNQGRVFGFQGLVRECLVCMKHFLQTVRMISHNMWIYVDDVWDVSLPLLWEAPPAQVLYTYVTYVPSMLNYIM